jgi:hypothetical protein
MLAFTMLSELSILEDELERLRLLVWLVETLAFTRPSDRSTLEELLERLLEVVLIAVSSVSRLEEEFESERLDV